MAADDNLPTLFPSAEYDLEAFEVSPWEWEIAPDVYSYRPSEPVTDGTLFQRHGRRRPAMTDGVQA